MEDEPFAEWAAYAATNPSYTPLLDLEEYLQEPPNAGRESSNRAVTRGHGGKSTSGCLVCRQRKIKCDERRPFCGNCQRSRRYTCLGYHDTSNETLSRYDASRQKQRRSKAARDQTRSATVSGLQLNDQPLHGTEEDPAGADLDPTLEEVCATVMDGSEGAEGSWPEGDLTELTTDIAPLAFPFAASASADTRACNPDPTVTTVNIEEDILLIHFRDVVCNYMMPVIEPAHNPWVQIYLPLATTELQTPSTNGLGHALRAIAAYHRAHLYSMFKTQCIEQAVSHQAKAQECVCRVMSQNTADLPATDKYALLAAALALISTDVFSNEHNDCDVHLDLAKQVYARTGDDTFWNSTLHSRTLAQLMRCYELMAATTGGQTSLTAPLQDFADAMGTHGSSDNDQTAFLASNCASFPESHGRAIDQGFVNGPYMLDSSFGLGKQTFSLLKETVSLDAVCARYSASQLLPAEVLGRIQYLWERVSLLDTDANPTTASETPFVNLPSLASSESFDGSPHNSHPQDSGLPPIIRDEIMTYHKTAFHYALILYFHRILYRFCHTAKTSDARASEASSVLRWASIDGQYYVEKILECLENIDSLVRNTYVEPGSTLWPAFIAAAEAVDVRLRQRAMIWLVRAARRGLGNIARSREIVMETWRRADRLMDASAECFSRPGLGPVDWRAVMREKGSKIMLA